MDMSMLTPRYEPKNREQFHRPCTTQYFGVDLRLARNKGLHFFWQTIYPRFHVMWTIQKPRYCLKEREAEQR